VKKQTLSKGEIPKDSDLKRTEKIHILFKYLRVLPRIAEVFLILCSSYPNIPCGCPLPGSVQGQVGWGFEQPGLVEGVPAHGRGVGTRLSIRSLPTQTIL